MINKLRNTQIAALIEKTTPVQYRFVIDALTDRHMTTAYTALA